MAEEVARFLHAADDQQLGRRRDLVEAGAAGRQAGQQGVRRRSPPQGGAQRVVDGGARRVRPALLAGVALVVGGSGGDGVHPFREHRDGHPGQPGDALQDPDGEGAGEAVDEVHLVPRPEGTEQVADVSRTAVSTVRRITVGRRPSVSGVRSRSWRAPSLWSRLGPIVRESGESWTAALKVSASRQIRRTSSQRVTRWAWTAGTQATGSSSRRHR
ncbi:hypothetical protein OG401_00830 [Kitasatospora purpeofusca]|uniref:hypothetical protein n=1 Tax=Kitasatospora purpeofusca TaxID=67352 RepID=UPI002256809D|nr:hypothetical protein [Kitasatospora purpeofusca]MCX4682867.1 hypothetical protein [Kitasatospora purpeofusca]